jgi:hypothetical protein
VGARLLGRVLLLQASVNIAVGKSRVAVYRVAVYRGAGYIARALLLGTEVQEQNITGDAESESLVDKGRKLGFALHEPGYGQSRRVRLTEGILDGSGGTSSKRLIRHAESAGRLE